VVAAKLLAGAVLSQFVALFGVALGLLATAVASHPASGSWLDITRPSSDLLSGSMDGQRWEQLAVASLIWVVALLVAGVLRLRRKEIA
jgi:ABC-2 type transport system permease protein